MINFEEDFKNFNPRVVVVDALLCIFHLYLSVLVEFFFKKIIGTEQEKTPRVEKE